MPRPTPARRKSSLLEQVRQQLRLKHFSIRTEQAYVQCIKRFILYHGKRHPAEMGVDEIRNYLSHLATSRNVSASTQNLELAALLFLYRYLPNALKRKYPNSECGKAVAWQWAFPAGKLSIDPRSGKVRRHHVSEDALQRDVKRTIRRAQIEYEHLFIMESQGEAGVRRGVRAG
jgi:hypothetical protein